MRFLALAALVVATPAAAADQFDLVCRSTKNEVTRYRVDLASREWCWEGCKATWRIADVTSARIVFKDEKTGTSSASNFVNRATGEFWQSATGRWGAVYSSGVCEPAPFSGFPKAKF